LKDQLAKTQNRMKLQADVNRIEHSFQVGEQVLLKLQPYAQSSVVNEPFPKLAYKYFVPYAILERIRSVAYKLDLPPRCSVHPVFHVFQLKSFTPDHSSVYSKLPDTPLLNVAELTRQAILDRRLVKRGNEAVTQVLIQWSSLSASSATWKDYHVLHTRYPSVAAWGQAASPAVGSVTTTPAVAITG
jgi:hypothetical protein